MADRLNRSRLALLGGIRAIDGLEVLGDPQATMWTVSSPTLDVYAIAEGMEARGWDVSRTREPEGLHLIVDPFEDDPLIADYLADLAASAAEVQDGRRTRATEAASTY
jgi:hypothetical protein